jgi:hypothetical protein
MTIKQKNIKLIKRAASVVDGKGNHITEPYIITEKSCAQLVTINIELDYISGEEQGVPPKFQLYLEGLENSPLNLEQPVTTMAYKELESTIANHSGHYLDPRRSYISTSLIRPYGVGIHPGDVIKRSIRLAEVKNLFLMQFPEMLREPKFHNKITENSNQPVTFTRKKRFERAFSEEFELPIFVESSLCDIVARKNGAELPPIVEYSSFLKSAFPHRKIKVKNEGRRLNKNDELEYVINDIPAQGTDHFHVIEREYATALGRDVSLV